MENTLIAELGSWNRQEQKFRELFSEEALKDREFQKMKLGEYDRLYHKYSGKATTTDEKALLVMVRFQRRKLERALYPGLITRLLRRGFSRLKHLVQQSLQAPRPKMQQNDYGSRTIPLPRSEKPQEKPQGSSQRQHYGRDLGSRLRNGQQKKKGQSL